MECATKPTKPSSNISEIVSKFAKVCRLRSIGVFSENPFHHQHQHPKLDSNAMLAEEDSDVTEETECNGEKIHPQPVEIQPKGDECAAGEILKLFDTISALKVAYVQLQQAHVPYDPEKIKAANELVLDQLEALCKIKRAYKEKQLIERKTDSYRSSRLLVEIQVNEKQLEKLKSQNKAKNSDILCLRRELEDLDLKNAELVEKLKKKSLEKANSGVLSLSSFQDIFKAVSKSIHDFAKPLISLMKASGWDLERAVNSIEESVLYSKRSHKKYAFEAYIARRMFYGISLQSYYVDNIMKFDDPIDALIEDPDSGFAQFCKTKYLLVVHPKLEVSFFGNLDHRTFVSSGKHPRTPFYQAFVKMAKWVWVLQGIAGSIEPKAEIFGVKRGSQFSDVYMECVEEDKEDMVKCHEGQGRHEVEFMVLPGFRIGETLIRSRVYLSKVRSSNGTC
ncbi:hypothetical protein L1049_013064 [Liquidambar formosana]|uniref:DUF641 domain-containing protein n=1 Tax=Liquidambar formosana TaxID=63359 RepID=A0AAP0WXV3_LIQFO